MLAASIPRKRAVGVDDPVARDDDRDTVVAVRPADRARGEWPAELARDPVVRRGLGEGDLQQLVPDGGLEWCAVQIERDGELLAQAQEVLVQLALRLLED